MLGLRKYGAAPQHFRLQHRPPNSPPISVSPVFRLPDYGVLRCIEIGMIWRVMVVGALRLTLGNAWRILGRAGTYQIYRVIVGR